MTEPRTAGTFTQNRGFSYRIVKPIAVIGGFGDEAKELNLVSFGKYPPKYDIRAWTTDDNGLPKMLKGITLSRDEAIALRDALNKELKDA
jgi:hypothetical protein